VIKDRGNKKWVSLMLPEHKKLLGKFYQSQNDVKMPELDEQRLEEINATLLTAIHENRLVLVTYFKANRYHEKTGMIKSCNTLTGTVVLITEQSEYQDSLMIPFSSIIQVQMV
jgi:hypothetical protein